MKNRLFPLILLAVLLIFSLSLAAGCAGSKKDSGTKSAAPANKTDSTANKTATDSGAKAKTNTPKEIVFMTGSPGGSFQAFGGVVQKLVQEKIPGLSISVLPGGSGNNILGIEQGKAAMGLSNSYISVNAKTGEEPFEKPVTKMRHLVTLWPQWFQLFVQADSNIKSVKDLRGKKLVTLKKGSAGEQGIRDVLKVYGMSYKDMAQVSYQSSGEIAEMMVDKHADAGASFAPIPASYYNQLATSRAVRAISLEDKLDELHKLNPGYIRDKIPAGSYPGVEKDVPTVSNFVHIVVSADLDEGTAYDLTKTLVENYQVIKDMGSEMKDVRREAMALDVGIQYHPGALKYFKEAGLLNK